MQEISYGRLEWKHNLHQNAYLESDLSCCYTCKHIAVVEHLRQEGRHRKPHPTPSSYLCSMKSSPSTSSRPKPTLRDFSQLPSTSYSLLSLPGRSAPSQQPILRLTFLARTRHHRSLLTHPRRLWRLAHPRRNRHPRSKHHARRRRRPRSLGALLLPLHRRWDLERVHDAFVVAACLRKRLRASVSECGRGGNCGGRRTSLRMIE
jgi:hypothetical protein